MKRYVIIILAIVILIACKNSVQVRGNEVAKNSSKVPAIKMAAIKFEEESHSYGVITYGQKVTHVFKFKNTGTNPLIITKAKASCGCTVPERPKKPINPGEEGSIKVVFNSLGKSGMQDAVITILSNTEPGSNTLHLTGEIRAANGISNGNQETDTI